MNIFKFIKNKRKENKKEKDIVRKVQFIANNGLNHYFKNSLRFNNINVDFENVYLSTPYTHSDMYRVSRDGVVILTIHNSKLELTEVLVANPELKEEYFEIINSCYIRMLNKLEEDLEIKRKKLDK